ncbi:PAS domain S-box protein [Gelidibacter maritimus]|uniref:histidine kinase n=1 Tax=Gelidibacter maritimus TaxID=2761487 RepID=A0A7W2R251_9FLAO|nr:PAS domain S-box protein [Gelidibacter maritimus]MBA6151409.1 PAS domain S-box protein [Gelidibacter maritimus]
MKNKGLNNDLLQHIFEFSAEGIMAVTELGAIVTANPAGETLFGFRSGELDDKNIEILIPKKLNLHYKNDNEQPNSATKEENGIIGLKKDGRKFLINLVLKPTNIDGKNLTIIFFQAAEQEKNDLNIIKRTNAELIESNRKFDALINNLKGMVFRCINTKAYEMDYVSEGCLEITGYSIADFLNHKVSYGKLILEAERDAVWEDIQSAIKQKTSYSVEYRIHHKDGRIKYVWEKGTGIYDDHNKGFILEGIITDITLQKETELELRRSESKTKALLKANPDVMFIQDHQGVYLDWYANSPEKLSIQPENFIGLNMKEVLPLDVYQKIKSSHKKAIASGKMQVTEISTQDNGVEHFEARVVPMSNDRLLTIVRDVTEKLHQDALLTIQNNALASAGNSILIADAQQPHHPIIYCNTAFEKMTGFSREDILENNLLFLRSDARDIKEIERIENAIFNGKACKTHIRNYRKDGSMFWNDITITPVHNDDNKLTHFISVQNDVTNKINEAYLKDKVRKILELIVQDNPIKTIGNEIVKVLETHFKDSIASIFLLEPEAETLYELAAPNLPQALSASLNGLKIGPNACSCGTTAFSKKETIVSDIQTNALWEGFKEIASKNGLKSCWSFPILSSTEEVLGTISIYNNSSKTPLEEEKKILLDMTHLASIAIESRKNTNTIEENRLQLEKYAKDLEQKVQERTQEVMETVQKLSESNVSLEDQIRITNRAENEAVKSKNIASKIAENFPNGFVAVMNDQSEILFAKGDALDQLGLKQFYQEGMFIDDISAFSNQRKERIKESIQKTLSGEHLTFEVNYNDRYFAVNTAPLIDKNNRINSALHVYNDISKQKEIEFSIQNALKSEQELNDLKSRFVSLASHEFRTPLSAILTSAILIGKQNEEGMAEKRAKYLARIERNVNNLTVILNDFLSLSKMDEGKVMPIMKRFDLIAYCKKMVQETNINLKKNQTISIGSVNAKLFVNLDVKLLNHILNNLLSNASKYSPEASTIDFKISDNNNTVVIAISDQGIGIPQNEHKYLFGRFFRAKNAVNIEGTGLGLNIAKHYTELMGGHITFKSELNKGTTFTVVFPIQIKK